MCVVFMNFVIPKRKHLNILYKLTKKLFLKGFFDFVNKLGQRIFYITTKTDKFVAIVSPDDFKIDIFYDDEGFLSCHNLLSGDERAVHSYGVACLSLTECDSNLFGFDYYLKKFKFYKHKEDYIGYVSHKFGQRPAVIDINESKIFIDVLSKLILIQNHIQRKNKFEYHEEEMVCVFDFVKKTKFNSTYILLNNFDFLPDLHTEKYSEYEFLKEFDLSNVIPGVIHIGQIDSFKAYEIYNDIADFEFGLTSLYLYGLTENGDVIHYIYSTPKFDYNRIFIAMASMFFDQNGIYDTIVTDNFMVYSALIGPLEKIGVTVKFEPNNDVNIFITKFIIKMSQISDDASVIDEVITSSKEDLKELFLNNISNLAELNETFFSNVDEEEADDETEESDDDDSSTFVS